MPGPAIALILLAGAAGASGEPEWVGEARTAAAELGSRLKAELMAAISESGPAGGIEVCRQRAPGIAAELSANGVSVGRTALRIRNPDNAPDAWERNVLERFEDRIDAGADPAGLETWRVQDEGNGRVGRWMKAIPTAPECLLCHGTNPAPEIEAMLDRLYPEDRATGFAVGDLRGAFTVEVELPSN